MNDGYLWWFILVGAVIALAVVWVVAARLPRDEDDVSEDERRAEAAWISETIERYGGVAPQDLVEEVLELHAGIPRLAAPRADARAGRQRPDTGRSAPAGERPPSVRAAHRDASPANAPQVVSGPPLPPPAPPPPLGRVERRPPPAPPR